MRRLIVAFLKAIARLLDPLFTSPAPMCTSCKLSESRGDCSGRCACSVQEMPDDLWVPPNANGTLVFRHEQADKSGLDRSAFLTELASATSGLGTFHPGGEIYGPDPDSPLGEWVDPELLRAVYPVYRDIQDEFSASEEKRTK